jgi:hypothetical protein
MVHVIARLSARQPQKHEPIQIQTRAFDQGWEQGGYVLRRLSDQGAMNGFEDDEVIRVDRISRVENTRLRLRLKYCYCSYTLVARPP